MLSGAKEFVERDSSYFALKSLLRLNGKIVHAHLSNDYRFRVQLNRWNKLGDYASTKLKSGQGSIIVLDK